jgi:hypothetical protein
MGRVVFQKYITEKRKIFGIKLCKLCEGNGYMSNMAVYVGKNF